MIWPTADCRRAQLASVRVVGLALFGVGAPARAAATPTAAPLSSYHASTNARVVPSGRDCAAGLRYLSPRSREALEERPTPDGGQGSAPAGDR